MSSSNCHVCKKLSRDAEGRPVGGIAVGMANQLSDMTQTNSEGKTPLQIVVEGFAKDKAACEDMRHLMNDPSGVTTYTFAGTIDSIALEATKSTTTTTPPIIYKVDDILANRAAGHRPDRQHTIIANYVHRDDPPLNEYYLTMPILDLNAVNDSIADITKAEEVYGVYDFYRFTGGEEAGGIKPQNIYMGITGDDFIGNFAKYLLDPSEADAWERVPSTERTFTRTEKYKFSTFVNVHTEGHSVEMMEATLTLTMCALCEDVDGDGKIDSKVDYETHSFSIGDSGCILDITFDYDGKSEEMYLHNMYTMHFTNPLEVPIVLDDETMEEEEEEEEEEVVVVKKQPKLVYQQQPQKKAPTSAAAAAAAKPVPAVMKRKRF